MYRVLLKRKAEKDLDQLKDGFGNGYETLSSHWAKTRDPVDAGNCVASLTLTAHGLAIIELSTKLMIERVLSPYYA